MDKPIAPWFALALVVLVLDQVTKYWASTALLYAVPREIWTGFNLTLLHNTGAAFSLFSDQPGWQRWFFTAIASVISVVVIVWMWRLRRDQYFALAALGLILGGALGNLIDRINHGYVIDFIQLYYADWYWPAFNIADSAITVGAAILIIKGPGESPANASGAELDQT